MESITEITIRGKSPKEIYDFMFSLTQKKYILWHPEHQEFKVIKTTAEITGSIFYFKEIINGFKIQYNWEVVQVMKNHKILMRAKYFYPISLELVLRAENNNTIVKHILKIGKKTGFISKIISRYFFTEKVEKDLQRHAIEEFTNLEWLI